MTTIGSLGSSPLTRGKRLTVTKYSQVPWLIPAHAGKTTHADATAPRAAAHPRSRGENHKDALKAHVIRGSSPLTRGKHQSRRECRRGMGLIPAHAGKTRSRPPCPVSSQAHPRSRGENFLVSATTETLTGSSPLTRGKREGRGLGAPGSGLIPAHAGKTAWIHRETGLPWAHPRSRGENPAALAVREASAGSSPLTRGKRRDRNDCGRPPGLIPAHAGKTQPRLLAGHTPGAHPRSRGENAELGGFSVNRGGSSPLTRGKLAEPPGPPGLPRLIPAHAGKTFGDFAGEVVAGAHPRSRGENCTSSRMFD